jgi:hypothetical protein
MIRSGWKDTEEGDFLTLLLQMDLQEGVFTLGQTKERKVKSLAGCLPLAGNIGGSSAMGVDRSE